MGVFVAQTVSVDVRFCAQYRQSALFALVMGFGVMLGAGGSAVIAKNIGEGEEQQAFDNLEHARVLRASILGLVFYLASFHGADLELCLANWRYSMPYCKEYCYYIVGFWHLGCLELMFSELFHHGRKASTVLSQRFVLVYSTSLGITFLSWWWNVSEQRLQGLRPAFLWHRAYLLLQ